MRVGAAAVGVQSVKPLARDFKTRVNKLIVVRGHKIGVAELL
jgi:hypothetical protein